MYFLLFYAALHYAYFQIPDDSFRVIYHDWLGFFCAELINFFAPLEKVMASQNYLMSSAANLEIVRGCDGAGAVFLLVSAILAFPAGLKRKCLGLFLGVSTMYLINLIRISGLYFVIAYRPDWFTLLHTYFGPSLMIVLGSLFFIWWAFGSSITDYEAV
jgi:exosortase family protein XrtM